jgi:hypothetical protein
MPFLFVPLLVAAWMFGFAVAAFASHYFLAIVESSATATARNLSWKGTPFREWIRDGVRWPDDLFIDYFAKVFYLGYMILIWAGPAILLGRLLMEDPVWRLVIAGGAFWIFFPIGLLSSMASESRWNPFWPGVIVAFLCRPLKTLGFYILSAPILAVLFITFDMILLQTSKVSTAWAMALSPVAVFLFFVYGRLLGRLGMVVSFTRPQVESFGKKSKPRKPRRPIHAYDPATRAFMPKESVPDDPPPQMQPGDMPDLETPNDGPITGYSVDYSGKAAPIEEPKPARKIFKFDDEDDSPITVEPVHDIVNTDRARIAKELAIPREYEIALHLRERPTEPGNPFGAETVTFLLDVKTIDPWLRLTVGLIGMALLQRALDTVRPVLE